MEQVLKALCARVPAAIGAVVCDDEGETVVSVLGRAPPPEAAEQRARDHVPRSMALHMPVGEFLVRLVGAEVCAVLRAVDHRSRAKAAGAVFGMHIAYREVDLLLSTLPDDYYVVVVLRRPVVVEPIWQRVLSAVEALRRDILE